MFYEVGKVNFYRSNNLAWPDRIELRYKLNVFQVLYRRATGPRTTTLKPFQTNSYAANVSFRRQHRPRRVPELRVHLQGGVDPSDGRCDRRDGEHEDNADSLPAQGNGFL